MNPLTDIIEKDIRSFVPKIDFRKLDGKSVLVTGASGLIGTYVLATLSELRRTGANIVVSAVVLHPFPDYLKDFGRGVNFIEGDLENQKLLASLPAADFIIHAAGFGQPGKFLEEPLKTVALNTAVTIALKRKLKAGGTFLFLSTSEVYSGLPTPPYSEEQIGTTSPLHPRACYIESKRCGEAIVNAMRAEGLDAKSARLSLAYGPGTKRGDRRVLNVFIEKALRGSLKLLDQGAAKRTYCYVADAVEILWRIALEGREAVYNVGGVGKVSIRDLALKIGAALNVAPTFPEAAQGVTGAPSDVSLDMTRVAREFGKRDFVPLDEGLRHTIEWQKVLYNSHSN